jgi:hypothetical protein
MMEQEKKEYKPRVVWCIDCGKRLDFNTLPSGLSACPTCGSNGIPADASQDVIVEMNWHELRILTIWAENYARAVQDKHASAQMARTVFAIARRLRAQHPGFQPLTFSEEIASMPSELAKEGIEVIQMIGDVPRPVPVIVNGPGAVGFARRRVSVEPTEALVEEVAKRLHGAESMDLGMVRSVMQATVDVLVNGAKDAE